MSDRHEACERLITNIEDAIESLERGKEECAIDDWDFFSPEEMEEILEQLREIVAKLNVHLATMEDEEFEEEEE
jgi:molecular chaperone GrpE (heat shock protein)